MSSSWDCEITKVDGTVETIRCVEKETVADGVLTLVRYRPYSGGREHLGSWPLVNVAKWKRVDQ